jgi:hypothetical protein
MILEYQFLIRVLNCHLRKNNYIHNSIQLILNQNEYILH